MYIVKSCAKIQKIIKRDSFFESKILSIGEFDLNLQPIITCDIQNNNIYNFP